MSKNIKKPLTKEEVSKHRPVDPVQQLAAVMGFGLNSAYDLALKDGATQATRTNPEMKAGNVEKLPTTK